MGASDVRRVGRPALTLKLPLRSQALQAAENRDRDQRQVTEDEEADVAHASTRSRLHAELTPEILDCRTG